MRIAAPTRIPAAVPASALRMVRPVPSAFERGTDSVPRTTQKECWRPDFWAMNTATASPAAPRTLLRNHTERALACSTANCRTASNTSLPPLLGPLVLGATVGGPVVLGARLLGALVFGAPVLGSEPGGGAPPLAMR